MLRFLCDLSETSEHVRGNIELGKKFGNEVGKWVEEKIRVISFGDSGN